MPETPPTSSVWAGRSTNWTRGTAIRGGRRVRPDTADLAGPGHHLLLTRCGPVVLLGTIGHERRYEDLLADAVTLELGGLSVKVLGLAALIRTKEEAGREKDRAVLDLLRQALQASETTRKR
jgi:hypothetical protein